MTAAGGAGLLEGGAGLLERALAYSLGSVAAVTPALLPRPTPCGEWDLRGLLHHLNDSLAALHEAAHGGRVALDPAAVDDIPAADPVRTFRERAVRLLGAWSGTVGDDHDRVVLVGDLPLAAGMVAATGAVELAVHGWDVSQSCGQHRPIPDALATELLELCPLLVPPAPASRCSPPGSSCHPWPARATGWSPSSAATPPPNAPLEVGAADPFPPWTVPLPVGAKRRSHAGGALETDQTLGNRSGSRFRRLGWLVGTGGR
jgi:uncharacterized protein (TIGR03086 family)